MSSSLGMLALAQQSLRQGHPHGALRALRLLLGENPDDANAHALLAITLLRLKRLHAAELEAWKAVSVDPELPFAVHALALIAMMKRRFPEARQHFEHLLALDPHDAQHHLSFARLERLEGRTDAAVERLERARELDPELVDPVVDLGELALARGDRAEAQRLAEVALTLEPEDADAQVLQGNIRLQEGDVGAAREHAAAALSEDVDHEGALRLLASIKARQDPFLGLWWRWSTWMNALGTNRMTLVLLAGFIAYRVLAQIATDLGSKGTADLITLGWLGICVYTWVAPGLFARKVRQELGEVRLSRDF